MHYKALALEKFDRNSEDGSHLHWKLYYGLDAKVQSNLVATSGTIKDFSKEASRKHLDWTLQNLQPDTYLLQFKNEVNDTNGIIAHRFEVPYSNGNSPVVEQGIKGSMQGNGNYSKEDIEERITLALKAAQAQWEKAQLMEDMTELRKEIKALSQKAQGNNLTSAINGVKEVMMMLKGASGAAGPQGPRIAIAKGGNIPAEDAEAQQYYSALHNEVMQKMIARADNNPYLNIELLYCLNRWIEEHPVEYESMILPQILVYQKELANRGE